MRYNSNILKNGCIPACIKKKTHEKPSEKMIDDQDVLREISESSEGNSAFFKQ